MRTIADGRGAYWLASDALGSQGVCPPRRCRALPDLERDLRAGLGAGHLDVGDLLRHQAEVLLRVVELLLLERRGAQYLGSHQPRGDHLVLTKQHWLDSGSRYPRQLAQGLTHFCHITAIGVTRERIVECCVVRTQVQDTVITHLE